MNIETIGIVVLTFAVVAFWIFVTRRALHNASPNDKPANRTHLAATLIAWLFVTASLAASGIVTADARWMVLILIPAFGGDSLPGDEQIGAAGGINDAMDIVDWLHGVPAALRAIVESKLPERSIARSNDVPRPKLRHRDRRIGVVACGVGCVVSSASGPVDWLEQRLASDY